MGYRFYEAGIQSMRALDWVTAADDLSIALHLHLYPYLGKWSSTHAWYIALTSSEAGFMTLRARIGHILLSYSQVQHEIAVNEKDMHAADLAYLASEAAAMLFTSLESSVKELPVDQTPDEIRGAEIVKDLRAAKEARSAIAASAARLLGDAGSMVKMRYALTRRGGDEHGIEEDVDVVAALVPLLSVPVKLACDDGGGGGASGNNKRSVECDEAEFNDEELPQYSVDTSVFREVAKGWREAACLDGLLATAKLAVQAVPETLHKEVDVHCWDDVLGQIDMVKCREEAHTLWTNKERHLASADVSETEPSPVSLKTSNDLVSRAMRHFSQVLIGTSMGMRHPTGAVALKSPGFGWWFMDYFYADNLEGGTGEALALAAAAAAKQPPPGAAETMPSTCIDYSELQMLLPTMNESSLSHLNEAMTSLESAQTVVGGAAAFWDMVGGEGDVNTRLIEGRSSISTCSSGGSGGASRQKQQQQHHHHLGASLDMRNTPSLPLSVGMNAHGTGSGGSNGLGMHRGLTIEAYEKLLARVTGRVSDSSASGGGGRRQRVGVFKSIATMTMDDAALSIALLLCFVGAVSLYRAVSQFVVSHWRKAHGGGRGRSGRHHSSHSHGPSAGVIAQRAAAAAALREAMAVESVPRLSAAVKAAEEAGVERPLVKKGKNVLQHLKKRKAAAGAPPERKPHQHQHHQQTLRAAAGLSSSSRVSSPTTPFAEQQQQDDDDDDVLEQEVFNGGGGGGTTTNSPYGGCGGGDVHGDEVDDDDAWITVLPPHSSKMPVTPTTTIIGKAASSPSSLSSSSSLSTTQTKEVMTPKSGGDEAVNESTGLRSVSDLDNGNSSSITCTSFLFFSRNNIYLYF